MRRILDKLFPKKAVDQEEDDTLERELIEKQREMTNAFLDDSKTDAPPFQQQPKSKHTPKKEQEEPTTDEYSKAELTKDNTFDENEIEENWSKEKDTILEDMLGKPHSISYFSLIPYEIGGNLNLFYYPDSPFGTAIVTKQLSQVTKPCVSNNEYKSFELAMYTNLDPEAVIAMEQQEVVNIANTLNKIAQYSSHTQIDSGAIIEFPAEEADQEGEYFIVLAMTGGADNKFGIMSPIQIFPVEMDYAQEFGISELITKLNDANHYPYSDMSRDPVV
ncbi:hypothetical protein O1D97_09905 [Marinomonas sp. 15G1-11]|uniref:Suppressor of fused protein SUFU n=1 Tax=Marinomonas phaeophyticola TaxID=3004091 RepID=A0ABT4JUD7_9GAMM|nr:hypothetical protein [Marinomonas sp. 15G1-11]MCZ2721955.1 hypothetical protein [Marinomonas sp. 15G1-11]